MKLRGSSCELLVLLLLVYSTQAAVINLNRGDACAKVCSGKETIFKYEENKIYVYNFLSKHSIKNPNAKDETLQLELRGKAQVSKISACDFGLLLSDIELKESLKDSVNQDYGMMKKMLEKYNLRFGFDDGRITGVCQDNMDNEFAVNIKRAILSSLQVSLDGLDTPNYLTETDIAGDCITEYTTKPETANFVIVSKKKSISGCSRKSKYFSSITGREFDRPKESRNLALLDGSYSCEIKIKRSEGLKESICQESHIFKPFISDNEGSTILINQELRFDSIKNGKIETKAPMTRSDLIMNHGDKNPLFMKAKQDSPKSALQELCRIVKENSLSVKITDSFISLIRSLSEASYDDIKSLDKFISDDPVCGANKMKIRNIFWDTLSNVKTDAAFRYLIDDAKIFKLSNLGLSIFENPSSGMIATLSTKIADAKTYTSIALILSSMIKSFCENNQGCMLNPDVIRSMDILTKNLGTNCVGKPKNMLYTLRSLGNAGSHPNYDKLINILKSCTLEKSNDDDIKVHSIQVFRQYPCNDNIDNFLWSIFDDVSFSSEVRIEAYLSLVRCPTKGVFAQVIQKLKNEMSQQLGSFVWSHISNLMETSDRFKEDVRDMLQIFTTPMSELEKKFNLDFRSYSKNIEKTYQKGYSAAKFDTNIIFSSSPIPSSISVNTTLDIFGRSINIFEMGIRGKGISEKIFGVNSKAESHPNAHPDVVKMHQKIKKTPERLGISVYSRFMGKEVFFSPNIIEEGGLMLVKLSKNPSIERSLLLLDTTVSVTSISGFPVELQIESAASINLNVANNAGMTLTDIELSTKSNFGVQVTGKLLVNAHCTKIGVQSKGIISKEVDFGGKLKLKRTTDSDKTLEISDYQFEMNKMPDNSKLFSISNELTLIHKLKKVQTVETFESKISKCTGEGAMKVMGLKACISYKEAPKYSSFLPNFKAEVTMEKFGGFKFLWKKETTLKPIRKLRSFLASASFQDNEDSFRIKIDRDPKKKRQMYEILLWQKNSYLKFEINNQKVSGEIKSGANQAMLSGTIKNIGIFTTVMDLDAKFNKNSGKLFFSQKFSKNGPEIELKITKDGNNGFNLHSKTEVRITKHQVYNFFERFRHSTILKYSGDNEMSFVIDNSKGNQPTNELKSKVEIFWRTQTKRNFYISQNYLWKRVKDQDISEQFGTVRGSKFQVMLEHEIEAKDKKFNISNNFEYFLSENFMSLGNQPSLVSIKFKREDRGSKAVLFEASSRFGMDMSNMPSGSFLWSNLLNYPAQKIKKELSSKVVWKLNKLQMFDINADLKYSEDFKLSFVHKGLTTQIGKTVAEVRIGSDLYSIISELNLPKKHSLMIVWPKNSIEIDSEVDAKSLEPFNVVVVHNLKLNKNILAKVTNSMNCNQKTNYLSISSVGLTSKDTEIYMIDFTSKFKTENNKDRLFYDFASTLLMRIKGLQVDDKLVIEQYADIDRESKSKSEKKLFVSNIVLEQLSSKMPKMTYGYKMTAEKKYDSVDYTMVNAVLFNALDENKVKLKYGWKDYNYNLGVTMDLPNKLSLDIMHRMSLENYIVKNSISFMFDTKGYQGIKYYYKRNIVINMAKKNDITINWNGEFGEENVKNKVTSFSGLLKLTYKDMEKISASLTSECSSCPGGLASGSYILSIGYENKDGGSYQTSLKSAIRWQFRDSRTANYYDLQVDGNVDILKKSMDLNLILTKDSNLNKLLSIVGKCSGDGNVEVNFKYGERFAKFLLAVVLKDDSKWKSKLTLTTSSKLLKELNVVLEMMKNGDSRSNTYEMTTKGDNANYDLKINRIMRLTLVNKIEVFEEIKWKSNIPYIETGQGSLGLLSQGKDFQFNLNLGYKDKKIVELKVGTSGILTNFDVLFSSNISKALKFQSNYNLKDSTLAFGLQLQNGDKYFKISKMELMYKEMGKVVSMSMKILVETSIPSVKELTFKGTTTYNKEKISSTFKADSECKLNGKVIDSGFIDMGKGIISLKSIIGKYIEGFYFKSLEINSKHSFQSFRDFMIEYKIVLNEKLYSDVKLVYFRMKDGETSKKVPDLGEARFYLLAERNGDLYKGKLLVFIDKGITKGTAIMKMDVPQAQMKLDEVKMVFGSIKGSGNGYTGSVKYKGYDYQFTFNIYDGYKRDFQMKSNSKDAKPKEVKLSFDFTKDYKFNLSFDDYFLVDLSLLNQGSDKRSGMMKLSYKGRDYINMKLKTIAKVPSDMKNAADIIMGLLQQKTGIDLALSVDGKIMNTQITLNHQISRLNSVRFLGGTKCHLIVDLTLKCDNTRKYYLMMLSEKNDKQYLYEEDVSIKENDNIIYKDTFKFVYESLDNVVIKGDLQFKDIEMQFSTIYNKTIVEGGMSYRIFKAKKGFGFQMKKESYEITLFYENEDGKSTIETNIGSFVKAISLKNYKQMLGKKYYITSKRPSKSSSIEITMEKKKESAVEISSTLSLDKDKMTVSIKAYDDRTTRDTLGIEVKGTTTQMNAKYFGFKTEAKIGKNKDELTLSSNVNVNKNNVADLVIVLKSDKMNSPFSVKLDYKGTYKIGAVATLDTKRVGFTHSLSVKDGKFKTDLWSCSSDCRFGSEFDCAFNYITKSREMRIGGMWKENIKMAELTWDKGNGKGLIYQCEKSGKTTKIMLSTPLRTIYINHEKISEEPLRIREVTFKVIRKAEPNKPVTFSLKYDLKGSLASDYILNLLIKTNLMKKGVKLIIRRAVSMNIGDIYTLDVKASFDDEAKPFFSVEGYLRQLSTQAYTMKIHATNNENFVTLTSGISATIEELSFEYKLLQSGKKDKDFIFKFIPMRKLWITNKNGFEILFKRTQYQYGYRNDIVWKLGKKGPNVSAFSTLIKSPMKYYAEVINGEKKLVVHFRPVVKLILGEVYRKISGNKVLDMSLKMDIDSKNILTSKLYWNPKLVEIIKAFLTNIFKPENLRVLMADAYQTSENQLSSFTSNIKVDLVKTMELQNGLDFVKGFANDLEKIPIAFAKSYSDDDLYMKSTLDSAYKSLAKMNFTGRFSQAQNNVKDTSDVIFGRLYEWCVEGNLYKLIYESIDEKVMPITYHDIKGVIEGSVTFVRQVGNGLNDCIRYLAAKLDDISKKAEKVISAASKMKEDINNAYKDSSIIKMLELIREIKIQMLEGLSQIMETAFFKERLVYYQDSIKSTQDLYEVIKEMKKRVMKTMRASFIVNNTFETIGLIRSLKYKEAFLNMLKPEEAKLEIDLDKATMDIRLYVPPIAVPVLKIWKSASDWFPTQILTQLRGSGLNGKLLTLFYKYEYLVFNYGSLNSLTNLVPPFKKEAWVLDGNSILTYDGTSIRIGSGKCSYLLATDIKNRAFSLAMHIKSDSKEKEFELSYNSKVTISSSGEIKSDGKEIKSLPFNILKGGKAVEIYRDFDVTIIKACNGLVVKYMKSLDYLQVSLPGKLHGAVKGLLGSNDFDSVNDWATPDGRVTHDAGILSKSWSFDKCDSKTKTGLYSVKVDNNQLLSCMSLFKRDSMSYLSRCFSFIDPEPYLQLCQTSLQYKKMTNDEYQSFICNLSRNYVLRCKSEGMLIRLKKSCVKCGNIQLGKEVSKPNVEKNPKFNYIFIMEQSKCLATHYSLIENLFQLMKINKDNVYTLLSFNGRGIFEKPHFKSLNNEIITNKDGFETLLADFRKESQWSDSSSLNKSMKSSEAIHHAIKMPAKPGYIEKIILASCSLCKEHKQYLFSNLAGLLNVRGKSLTYLTTQNFTGKGLTQDTAGIGNSLVYSFSKDNLKSGEWKKDVQSVNDVCSSIARLDDGFVWSLNALTSKNRIRRVAETLSTELRKVSKKAKQSCSCGIGNYEEGRVECKTRGIF